MTDKKVQKGNKWAKGQISFAVRQMRTPLFKMTIPQLRSIIKTAKGFTQTNCGWDSYWAKDLIIKYAEDQIRNIKMMDKLKKSK